MHDTPEFHDDATAPVRRLVGVRLREGARADDYLAEDLTRELLDTRNRQAGAPRAQHPRRRADVLAIARERRDLLRLLLDSDPATVLRLALPAGIRAAFPAESQKLIEREVEVVALLVGLAICTFLLRGGRSVAR